ncbi:MAG TPA: NUDIX hydrolase [Acidimicrobiales bacterium]|nr:NUDIX hydrolase [Acidimicrobiales bacterium]
MPAEPGGFRRIGERERVGLGFLSIVSGTFVAPDGFTFERDIVRHPGAVCVVPLDGDDQVVCVRQYRSAVDLQVLEIPAGKMDVPGEPPEVGARRELAEEIGYAAASLTWLTTFYNSPGFTDEATHCFLGEGLTEVGRSTDGVEEQFMTVERFALHDVYALVSDGTLVDAKTILATILAKRLVDERRTASPARQRET